MVGTPNVGKNEYFKLDAMAVIDPFVTRQLPVPLFLRFFQLQCNDYTEKWFSYISAKYI